MSWHICGIFRYNVIAPSKYNQLFFIVSYQYCNIGVECLGPNAWNIAFDTNMGHRLHLSAELIEGSMPDNSLEVYIVFLSFFRGVFFHLEIVNSDTCWNVIMTAYQWKPSNQCSTTYACSISNLNGQLSASYKDRIPLLCPKWRQLCFVSINDETKWCSTIW